MTDAEEMVAFRLPARDRAAIQRLVDEGQFQNRSDFLRYAIKSTLREYPSAAAAPKAPDLPDLEGVSLPDPPARARAAPRARKGVNL
jgi:Arc/MetJ-type ribon-helix-helix transcriptional regulator